MGYAGSVMVDIRLANDQQVGFFSGVGLHCRSCGGRVRSVQANRAMSQDGLELDKPIRMNKMRYMSSSMAPIGMRLLSKYCSLPAEALLQCFIAAGQ